MGEAPLILVHCLFLVLQDQFVRVSQAIVHMVYEGLLLESMVGC
jgi:hypothetical protein